MGLIEVLDRAIDRLETWCRAHDFAGPDPYDGLASPLSSLAPGKVGRQVLVQGVKRAPRGTRAVLGIPPIRMTKALSLFARGYRRLPDRFDWERTGEPLLEELLDRRVPGEGWGYEFDVQTRWAFYPAGSSNIIVTSFVIEALHEASALARVPSETWRWLQTSMVAPTGHVRYVPSSDHLIHNANVLGARALLRSPVPDHRAAAVKALEVTVAAQRPDGSWPYGEGSGLEWVDNFHTVYVLEGLRAAIQEGADVTAAFERGLAYWDTTFMQHDPPTYLADGSGALDLHNLATAVLPLSWPEVELGPRRHQVVRALLRYQRASGELRRSVAAPSFMRWANAHAFNSLTSLRSRP